MAQGLHELITANNDLITAKELAEKTGYPYRQVWTYLKRGILPQPDYRFENKPLWKVETVETWLTNKKRGNDALRD